MITSQFIVKGLIWADFNPSGMHELIPLFQFNQGTPYPEQTGISYKIPE